jgi:hypothetical protein
MFEAELPSIRQSACAVCSAQFISPHDAIVVVAACLFVPTLPVASALLTVSSRLGRLLYFTETEIPSEEYLKPAKRKQRKFLEEIQRLEDKVCTPYCCWAVCMLVVVAL